MSVRDDVAAGSVPATRPLREEYAALESLLTGIVALAGRARAGERMHPLLLAGALTCLEAFQRCHDRKVEAALLPALRGHDASLATTAAAEAAREHQDVRARVAGLRRLLSGSRHIGEAICRLAEECVQRLRAHAAGELETLFAAADRLLSADEIEPLWASFREIDEREIRPGERQAMQALVGAISASSHAPRNVGAPVPPIVAAHVMRPRPRYVRRTDTLARAAEIMERAGIRELPVVDDGLLCGILSRSDLQPHVGHLEWTRVEAAMTAEPVVVSPETSVAAVSRTLVQGRFNAVPVVTDEATLVGMVSRSDLLRAVADDAHGAER